MEAITGAAARQQVQNHLNRKKEERLFHKADMEAIGVIDSKHEAERKAREEARRKIHERFAAEQRRIQQQEEDLRLQEEAYMAELAENRKGLYKAVTVAGFLCGIGSLHLIGAWRPDVAMVTGGLVILSGVSVIVVALAAYFRS